VAKTCWDWCTEDHEHNFGPGSKGFVRGVFMHAEERDEIFQKTGVRVSDRNEADRAMRTKGLREAERGEDCYDRFDALRECAEGKRLDDRFGPQSIDLYGDNAKRRPFDAHERYLQHRQRLGLS